MRRLQFKIIVTLILLISCDLYSQKLKVHNEELEINNSVETKVFLNVDNLAFVVEKSIDDKLHIDCELEFTNYTKAEIDETMKALTINTGLKGNEVSIAALSSRSIAPVCYVLSEDIVIKEVLSKDEESKEKSIHKSKSSMLEEVNKESIKTLEFLNETFKFEDQKGNEKKVSIDNVQVLKSRFVLRIPSKVKLFIKGNDTKIKMNGRMSNEMDIDMKGGSLKAKIMENKHNKVKMDDVDFKVEAIEGGEYAIANVSNVLMGSIENAKITSELSEMEIGEIKKNVSIVDFNSVLWLYNFSNDFEHFDLSSEYSKVHFFYPKTDYGLKVFGHNTVNYVGDMTVKMNPSKKEEKGLMMDRKPQGEGRFSGQIQFDMKHSIIHSYSNLKLEINKHQKQ